VDYANERYVRVFTRDTVGTLRLCWESRCVWWDFLRRVDRAGVVDLDGGTPADAVTALCRVPFDVAERAVSDWLRDGRLEHHEGDGGRLVVPHFLEAQEAPQSDAARARAHREKRRDTSRNVTRASQSVTQESQSVTEPSRPVTSSHVQSRCVTPSVPSLPIPDQIRSEREGSAEGGSQASPPEPVAPPPAPPHKRARKATEQKPEVPLPADWAPTAQHRAAAAELGVDLRRAEIGFRGWADGKCCASWNGRFATWLAGERPSGPSAGDRAEAAHAACKQQGLPSIATVLGTVRSQDEHARAQDPRTMSLRQLLRVPEGTKIYEAETAEAEQIRARLLAEQKGRVA